MRTPGTRSLSKPFESASVQINTIANADSHCTRVGTKRCPLQVLRKSCLPSLLQSALFPGNKTVARCMSRGTRTLVSPRAGDAIHPALRWEWSGLRDYTYTTRDSVCGSRVCIPPTFIESTRGRRRARDFANQALPFFSVLH